MSDLENEQHRKQKTLKRSITSRFGVSEPKCVKFLGFYFLVLTVSESSEHHKVKIKKKLENQKNRVGFFSGRI